MHITELPPWDFILFRRLNDIQDLQAVSTVHRELDFREIFIADTGKSHPYVTVNFWNKCVNTAVLGRNQILRKVAGLRTYRQRWREACCFIALALPSRVFLRGLLSSFVFWESFDITVTFTFGTYGVWRVKKQHTTVTQPRGSAQVYWCFCFWYFCTWMWLVESSEYLVRRGTHRVQNFEFMSVPSSISHN